MAQHWNLDGQSALGTPQCLIFAPLSARCLLMGADDGAADHQHGLRDYGAGERIKGRKRHIVVNAGGG